LREQLQTRYAKVEVLINYWEKLIIPIQLQATESGDKNVNELCAQILLIPPEVQYEVLKQWVKGCRDLHAIAFFQWRIMYPKWIREKWHPCYRHDYEKLTEIVEERIEYVRTELETEEKISLETLEDSKIDQNFLVKYNMAEQGVQSYLINGFQTIGWSDPYPDDDIFIKGSLDDGHNLVLPSKADHLVYPSGRYVEEHSPF